MWREHARQRRGRPPRWCSRVRSAGWPSTPRRQLAARSGTPCAAGRGRRGAVLGRQASSALGVAGQRGTIIGLGHLQVGGVLLHGGVVDARHDLRLARPELRVVAHVRAVARERGAPGAAADHAHAHALLRRAP